MQGLGTTNLILGIMAAVSVLEGLVIIGIAIGAYILYSRAMTLMQGLEERHVRPAMGRVNAILDDLKGVSTTVREETNRIDFAIRSTMDRVDNTADRVRSNVRAKTSRIVGFVRGARMAIETMLSNSRAA
jgi:hypothetical protein